MATLEPELSRPVDLCLPGGRRLNPEAVGWSRQPLHRANLGGIPGRRKRWDYWAVLTPQHAVSVTFADIDYLGIVDVWWCHLPSGQTGGAQAVSAFRNRPSLPETHGERATRWSSQGLTLAATPAPGGTRLVGRWSEANSWRGRLDVMIEQPPGHESLNVVVPWSDRRFQFTSKHQARPVRGSLIVEQQGVGASVGTGNRGQRVIARWPEDGPARGVLDVGRGKWPYRTAWNWGGGAGAADSGAVLGLQLGGKWTKGTPSTENGVFVDGCLHKIGTELIWEYDWANPMRPWTVRSEDDHLVLRLTPSYDRHSRTDLGVLGTEVHQVFGSWEGRFVDDGGVDHQFRGLIGFAEESRSRW